MSVTAAQAQTMAQGVQVYVATAIATAQTPVNSAAFVSRAELLKNSSARRLMQLAIPSDRNMVVDDHALRVAIEGGDLSIYSVDDQATLTLALEAIDSALSCAIGVIVSYGIPNTVCTPLLTRIACTIAMYYLQSNERMTETVQKSYDNAIELLKQNAKGLISLIPPDQSASTGTAATVETDARIVSAPRRYDGCE